MKRLRTITVVAAVAALSFSFNAANAQIFVKGSTDLNLQIGFGTTWYLSSYYHTSLPLISVGMDYGLREDWGPGVFGIGGIIGLSTSKYEYGYLGYDYGYKYTNFVIAPRATYHYQFIDKLDTYGGVVTGIEIVSGKEYGDWITGYEPSSDAGVNVVFTAFAGAKYYLTESFAVMSEIYVYDLALFNIGVCLKLK
jgi:hypothetical protein